jgi:hypothetical protein
MRERDAFLREAFGRWEIDGATGVYLFDRDEDVERFNALEEAILDAATEQEEMMRRAAGSR